MHAVGTATARFHRTVHFVHFRSGLHHGIHRMAQFRHSFLVVVHLVQVPFATKHEFVPVLLFVILWVQESTRTKRKNERKGKGKRKKESKKNKGLAKGHETIRFVCVATVTATTHLLLVNCVPIYCSRHSIHSSTNLGYAPLPSPEKSGKIRSINKYFNSDNVVVHKMKQTEHDHNLPPRIPAVWTDPAETDGCTWAGTWKSIELNKALEWTILVVVFQHHQVNTQRSTSMYFHLVAGTGSYIASNSE